MKKLVICIALCLLSAAASATPCQYLTIAYYAWGISDTFTGYAAANKAANVGEGVEQCSKSIAVALKLGKQHRVMLDNGQAIPANEKKEYNTNYVVFRDKLLDGVLKNAGF